MGPLSLSNRICSKEPLTTTKTHLVLHRRPLQRCYSKGSKRNGSGDEVGANVVQNMMTFSLWLSASWRRDRTSSKTPTPGARPLIISPYSCIKCLFSLSYFPLFLSYFVTESFSSFPPKYISNLECHIGKRSTNLKIKSEFSERPSSPDSLRRLRQWQFLEDSSIRSFVFLNSISEKLYEPKTVRLKKLYDRFWSSRACAPRPNENKQSESVSDSNKWKKLTILSFPKLQYRSLLILKGIVQT